LTQNNNREIAMSRKSKKVKATSLLPMCAAGGVFIGLGLGALMDNVPLVMLVCVLIGVGAGYAIDKKNGVTYGRH
jgi:F0F1-type ATP synthase assembly protein I